MQKIAFHEIQGNAEKGWLRTKRHGVDVFSI